MDKKRIFMAFLISLVSLIMMGMCYTGAKLALQSCKSGIDTEYTNTTLCMNRRGQFPFGYREGAPVHVTLTVRNISDQLLVLKPKTDDPAIDIKFDMSSYHEPVRMTLKWSEEAEGESFSQLELEPGQTYVINWTVVPSDYFSGVPIDLSILATIPNGIGDLYGVRISGDYGGIFPR